MEETNYTKIFEGSFIIATRLVGELESVGINPIIKDETESGRLAGFGASIQGFQQIYVSNEELDLAKKVLNKVNSELESS